MRHEDVLSSYIQFSEGQLDEREAYEVTSHLQTCGACRSAFQEFDGLLVRIDALGSAPTGARSFESLPSGSSSTSNYLTANVFPAPAGFANGVMENLEGWRRGRLSAALLRRYLLVSATSFAMVLLGIVLCLTPMRKGDNRITRPVPHDYTSEQTGSGVPSSVPESGGPTGSFSEAQFDDTLIRGSSGNLFRLVEGAFGAFLMVLCFAGTAVFGIVWFMNPSGRWARRMTFACFAGFLFSFLLRLAISYLFGDITGPPAF